MRKAVLAILPVLAPVAAAAAAFASDAPAGEYWYGPKMKGVPREEVFAFTKKPTFRKVGKDRYAIAFVSKGRCDVATAIHGPDGRIIRYLWAGVLGSNVPEPFEKNSLEQTVIWDGKDDFGNYVKNPEQCTARVSLGLKPTLDKVMCRHPKDVTGAMHAIGADKDGVYVVTQGPCQIKVFSHDARYLRTIYPWPPDKYAEGLVIGDARAFPPGGENFPRIGGYFPTGWAEGPSQLDVKKGRMLLFTVGWRDIKKSLRVGTDGTTRMQSIGGPTISRARSHIYGRSAYALDPDGVWIYYTPLGQSQHGKTSGCADCKHAIYRLAWVEDGPLGQPYIGEESKHAAKSDNRHLNNPQGIACDAKGRIYVCDYGNNRVQIFAPEKHEGKHLKTIRVDHPRHITVDQKTGEVYVHCYGPAKRTHTSGGWAMVAESRLVKAGGFDNPKIEQTWKLPWSSPRSICCVDTFSKPVRVWFGSSRSVHVFDIAGKKLAPSCEFDADVRKDGYNPHMLHPTTAMTKVIPQPGGDRLYLELSKGGTIRYVNTHDGKKVFPVYREWGGTFNCDEIHCGVDGFLYVRGIAWVGRFKHPTGKAQRRPHTYGAQMQGLLLTCADEVPFDYGERYKVDMHRCDGLRGVIRVPSIPGGNYFNMGFGVGPTGDILVLCENHGKKLVYSDRKELGLNEVGMRNYLKFLETAPEFSPQAIPGVLYRGQFVFIYDRRGELKGENVVPVPTSNSCGLRGDREDNIYIGLGVHCKDDKGKKVPYDGASAGAVVKFPPEGGLLYGKGSHLPKDRPMDFGAGYGGSPLWARNMFWKYNGYGLVAPCQNVCTCPNGRFDTDIFGRSFIPESYRHSTAIVDTNGNLITRVGTYGNVDTGVEKGGPVTIGYHCATGTDPDRYFYIADNGNCRILRVRLGYAAEEKVPLRK